MTFEQRVFIGGLSTKFLLECVQKYKTGIHRRVVHTISIVGVCLIDIHRRVVHIMLIVGVFPIDIHRRVVHKIDYLSVSTIYIGGLSLGKHKCLCLKMDFINGKMHV